MDHWSVKCGWGGVQGPGWQSKVFSVRRLGPGQQGLVQTVKLQAIDQ
jgi:hypothetical protein